MLGETEIAKAGYRFISDSLLKLRIKKWIREGIESVHKKSVFEKRNVNPKFKPISEEICQQGCG